MNELIISDKLVRTAEDADELVLYLNNDANTYRRSFIPAVKNLMKKRVKGVYDSSRAWKLFMYVVEFAAKRYCKEVFTPTDMGDLPWHKRFPKKCEKKLLEL